MPRPARELGTEAWLPFQKGSRTTFQLSAEARGPCWLSMCLTAAQHRSRAQPLRFQVCLRPRLPDQLFRGLCCMTVVILLYPLLLTSSPYSPQGHGNGNDDRILPLHLHHSGKVSSLCRHLLPSLLSRHGKRAGVQAQQSRPAVLSRPAPQSCPGGGEAGKGRPGALTGGESRARLSLRLESEHNDLAVASLQAQHCPRAHSERRQPFLWLRWTGSRRLCTDASSDFITPPSDFGFSAATHRLKDEHVCGFARL